MQQIFFLYPVLLLFVITAFSTFSLAQTTSLTPEEQAYIKAHPTITASNEMDWPPFNYNLNGEPKGYSIDFMQLAASKIGLNVEFVSGPSWNEFMAMVRAQEIDVILNISRTPERRSDFRFTEPYLVSVPSILVKQGSTEYSSLEELNGKTVAVPKGFDFHELLLRYYPKIIIEPTRGAKETLEALIFQQADAAIADLAVADFIAKENSLVGIHATAKVTDANFTAAMGMGVHKDHTTLRNILQKGMDKISDTEIFQLRSKWIRNFHQESPAQTTEITLTPEEKSYLKSRNEILLCVDPKLIPYEEIDSKGNYRGITADYFKVFSEQLGIPFRAIISTSWLDSLNKARARECDILPLLRKTRDRAKFLNFTKPYIVSNLVIATRSDVQFISNADSIGDLPIGMVKNYSSTEKFKRKYPNLNIVEVNNLEEGLELVSNNELFGMISTLTVIGYALQKNYLGELKVSGQFDENFKFSMGVRNDDPILLSIMNKIITSTPKETHRAIMNSWAPIRVQNITDYKYLSQIIALFVLFTLFIVYRQRQLKKYNQVLINLSTTDKLTSLPNRSKLDDMLKLRHREFVRYEHRFSVILLDIDKFKRINDTYGHPIGDEVLIKGAELIRDHTREVDCAGRWGGEEFLVICPNTDRQGAAVLAETIRSQFESHDFGLKHSITISAGVAEITEHETTSSLISRTDQALYKAKDSGRNRIVINESNPNSQPGVEPAQE